VLPSRATTATTRGVGSRPSVVSRKWVGSRRRGCRGSRRRSCARRGSSVMKPSGRNASQPTASDPTSKSDESSQIRCRRLRPNCRSQRRDEEEDVHVSDLLPRKPGKAGSRRVQGLSADAVTEDLQGSSDVRPTTRNEGLRGSNPRVGFRFAGIFGDYVVDFGNIAEHQPNTVVKGSGLLGTSSHQAPTKDSRRPVRSKLPNHSSAARKIAQAKDARMR
jgi:hypothetical protein